MTRFPARRRAPARGLAGAGLAAYAGWIEPRRLVVRELELALPHWPARLSGLRAGVMSDLHAGVPHAGLATIRRAVDALNAREPDVHLLLGDYLDASQMCRAPLTPEEVARRARAAALAAGIDRGDRQPRLAQLGRPDVAGARGGRDHRARGRRGRAGDGFWVAGLADLRHRRPDIGKALRDVPRDAPVLMLCHDPDLFPGVPNRVALTLSGHTHGGQVAIPLLRRPMLPVLLRRALRPRAHRRARPAPARHQRRRDERAADPLPRPARGRTSCTLRNL